MGLTSKRIFVLILFLLHTVAFSQNQNVILGKIDSDQTSDMSIVTMRLDKDPPYKTALLEEHGDFLQITLPNTVVSEPGVFIDAKSPYLVKIAAYQVQPDKAIIRIFVKEKASEIAKASEVEILSNRIILSLDHKTLMTNKITQIPTIPANSTDIIEADLPSKTVVAKAVPSKATSSQAEDETLLSTSKPTIEKSVAPKETVIPVIKPRMNLEDMLQKFAITLIFLIILILGGLTVKRFYRNRELAMYPTEGIIKMKAIGHLSLAPKQKLSLVQIGSEKLLLSVSSDNISFLAKISQDRVQTTQSLPAIPPSFSPENFEERANKMQRHVQKTVQERQQQRQPSQPNIHSQARAQKPQAQKQAPQSQSQSQGHSQGQRKSVSYKIDDQGITDNYKNREDDSLQDVTQLIREKLKSLPKL